MTMRIFSAKITLVPWFSRVTAAACCAGLFILAGAAPAPVTLASLVKAYRQAPAPAKRAAVTAYAASHSKEAPLAEFALGVADYEQKEYGDAVAALKKANGKLPLISDYTAYYLAASQLEAEDVSGVVQTLQPAHGGEVPSPYSTKALVLEARAMSSTKPAEGARLLRDHYGELPQPDGDLALGECAQAAGDLKGAAEAYQRVFYQYAGNEGAARAASAILALKEKMADQYPLPPARLLLRRADRLMQLRNFTLARTEYQALLDRPASLERDQARVRIGAVDFQSGKTPVALTYLASLSLGDGEADAERLSYEVECQRREGDDSEMLATLKKIGEKYPTSPWRLKALISAANRFLLVNRPDDYVPLYKTAYQVFPSDPSAATAHWKVAFNAWMRNKGEAGSLLREQLTRYPSHASAGAALYFLGREAEERREPGEARAFYDRICKSFENHYYALCARERLQRVEIQAAAPSPKTLQFLSTLSIPAVRPITTAATHGSQVRIERSRLLRTAGLADLADAELRFGARSEGQPSVMAMEMASQADAPNQAMRIMKVMSPEYMELPIESGPRKYWELLFPLPYRGELTADAESRGIDPYLLAGLIRQESEFDPKALSPAKAYGLTQVRPGTGRQFARSAGVQRFTTSMLYQPAVNLKIGSSILRSMLDQNGGHLERTLAAYNAGPLRASEWSTWAEFREPAEFVESIPFTETRDYVQAVLRNADIYRRLYR